MGLVLGGLALVLLAPAAEHWFMRAQLSSRLDAALARTGHLGFSGPGRADCAPAPLPRAALATEAPASSLASWQTVGGCGAGASTGSGTGIKWIGRGVSGGLFQLQCQTTYTRLEPNAERPEHHAVANTTLIIPLGDTWTIGGSLPVVYKYLRNPYETGADLSNSGIGDVSFMLSAKLGPIGATAVTATVGLPTGEFDGTYRMKILNQSQQRGFGKPTATLMVDHTHDELWGLTVLGASASWRGGENEVSNYRAPTAAAYAYVGYLLGALTPAAGLSVSGLPDHDRDQTVEQRTGLYIAAANVSLEWATDWVAFIVGASFPYQYDGLTEDTEGNPRSPWGWGPWMVGLGFSLSPF